jgi:AKAP7 2'5' RNA ligase-like domain
MMVMVICCEQIHQKVEEIQQSLLKRNKLFHHLFVPVPTLHLTVVVMHIADEEQLNV